MTFGELKPGDVFRSESGQVHIVPHFDIFAHDRVIRTHKRNASIAVILTGQHAGKYDGAFRDDDIIEPLTLEWKWKSA